MEKCKQKEIITQESTSFSQAIWRKKKGVSGTCFEDHSKIENKKEKENEKP